jgi:LacI family transcriptional regulator
MGDAFYPSRPEKREELIGMGLPTIAIAIEAQIPGVANILTNGRRIGTMAAEHLLDRGFRHFAYCGFDDIFWSVERSESFSKRVAKAAFQTYVYKQPRLAVQRLWENEQIFMADWLKSLPKPVGLMACNDDRGQQVIDACKLAGLRIPEEVAIIAVDNDELVCGLTNPPLSSIALNFVRAGYGSAELLDKLMTGKKRRRESVLVPATHIVTRQSTDILAIEDPEVVDAVRYIRQHVKEPIQVSDVTRVTSLSRRSLERRFRAIFGRSIHDEIRRVRTEQVARMLVDTNLPVSQIAFELGFPGVEHIARQFRKEKAITPLAYRKQYGYR